MWKMLIFFKSSGPVNKLDRKLLTLKLVMFMGLVTPQHTQTLHLVQISNTTTDRHTIVFHITDLAK